MSFVKDGTIVDLYETSAVNRSWQVRDHHILNNCKGKTPNGRPWDAQPQVAECVYDRFLLVELESINKKYVRRGKSPFLSGFVMQQSVAHILHPHMAMCFEYSSLNIYPL